MSNMDTAEIVICTLDKYQGLLEKAAQLERDVMTLQHQMEISKMEAELAEKEKKNNDLWRELYLLRNKLEKDGVDIET